jgi:hypothetical protein
MPLPTEIRNGLSAKGCQELPVLALVSQPLPPNTEGGVTIRSYPITLADIANWLGELGAKGQRRDVDCFLDTREPQSAGGNRDVDIRMVLELMDGGQIKLSFGEREVVVIHGGLSEGSTR